MEISILKQINLVIVLAVWLSKELLPSAVEPEDILANNIGPVVVLPHATLSLNYDDNVFFQNNKNKIDDFLTIFSPGLGLRYGENILDSNYIGLDYSPSLQRYAENTELNTESHALSFNINYQKQNKFIFTGTDQLRIDNTLLKGGQRSFFKALDDGQKATRGLLVERFSLEDNYRFEYIISPKTSAYVSTSLNMNDYEERPHYYYQTVFGDFIPYSLFDVSNWNNTVGFGWQAFPKIKLYGSFFYGLTSVDTNLERMGLRPDSNIYGSHISAIGNFSEKLTGNIQLGYQTRDFDRISSITRSTSHSLPIFQMKLSYNYSEKGDLAFSYTRGGNISIENPNTAVESDSLKLDLNQKLGTTGKLIASLSTTYQVDSYLDRNKLTFKNLRFNSGISYSFNQWMKSGLTYSFTAFDSDGYIDYNVNSVMLSFSVGY